MGAITDDPRLREKRFVFRDRHDAGRKLGLFIRDLPGITNPFVLAIPAGGIPVGKEVARALGAPLGLAIVRKVRIPGTTESGFGAVSWDGSVLINDRLRTALRISPHDTDQAIAETKRNVAERVARFGQGRPVPDTRGKTVLLTDDGLASGFTMLAAAGSVRRAGAAGVIVAVPTASASAVQLVAEQVDVVICLNIRSGWSFAVAEAYEEWHDLDDTEAMEELGASGAY